MPAITIRDVPDDARDELAARAARSGRSLQEFLRMRLVEWAETPDLDVVIGQARSRVAATGTSLPAKEILRLRDDARR